jgi:hypothetical protein
MHTLGSDDMTKPQVCGPLPRGQYYARATWLDASGFQWRGPRQIVRVPGPNVDLEVVPPKQTRRNVRISGTADLLNRHVTDGIPIIGTEPWTNTVAFDSGFFPMGLDFANVDAAQDPEFLAWLKENYPSETKKQAELSFVWEEEIEKWGVARATFVLELTIFGLIDVTVTGGTRKRGEDNFEMIAPQPTISILPKTSNNDPAQSFSLQIERTGPAFPPVRATLEVQIDNNRQSG